jgi:indole-3-glycerol phosphate synthase
LSGVLERILASKRAEIDALRSAPRTTGPHAPRGDRVAAALRREAGASLRLICEIKRRSPSAGALSTALSPAARAVAYAESGATMISVLCDAPFFDGAWAHVAEARAALADRGLGALVLAKEFVLDEAQLDVARASGADAVLLIARIVDPPRLAKLVAEARARGLEPLVEVATEDELVAANDAASTVVGVNVRDLDTLAMDAARASRVLAAIEAPRVPVHLSGLKSPEDVRAVARSRADAALVGEALMREDDPRALLAAMADAARSPRAQGT